MTSLNLDFYFSLECEDISISKCVKHDSRKEECMFSARSYKEFTLYLCNERENNWGQPVVVEYGITESLSKI